VEYQFQQIVDESIRLERNVGRLYLLFSHIFDDDESFWWELAIEEENHAALLKSGKICFIQDGLFPREIFDTTLEALLATNLEIEKNLHTFESSPPSRAEAFQLAIHLEISAVESCYQRVVDQACDSVAAKLFKKLNRDNKDHVHRIQQYCNARDL